MRKQDFAKHPPHRFALIGLPGSGKSTFAAELGKLLHIPVHHLDRHVFEPNGKKRDKQDFLSIQKAIVDFHIFRNQKDADRYLESIASFKK